MFFFASHTIMDVEKKSKHKKQKLNIKLSIKNDIFDVK